MRDLSCSYYELDIESHSIEDTFDCTRSFGIARVNASRPLTYCALLLQFFRAQQIPPSTQSLERGLVLDHQSPKLRLDSKALERP